MSQYVSLKCAPSHGGLSNAWFLEPLWIYTPNGISVGLAIFTGFNKTDHTSPSVAIGHILIYIHVLQPGNWKVDPSQWNHPLVKWQLCAIMKCRLDCLCRLVEPSTNSEIACYPIHSILFCARGSAESEERRCFAFTCSHGESVETAIFQCHVFRCDVTEAVMLCCVLYFTDLLHFKECTWSSWPISNWHNQISLF